MKEVAVLSTKLQEKLARHDAARQKRLQIVVSTEASQAHHKGQQDDSIAERQPTIAIEGSRRSRRVTTMAASRASDIWQIQETILK